MERLASILLLAAMGSTTLAAVSVGADPQIDVTVDTAEVILPEALPLGAYDAQAQVNAVVLADCPHAIALSFDGFLNERTGEVYTDGIAMRVNNVGQLKPGELQVLFGANRPTPSQGAALPLTLVFSIDDLGRWRPGSYRGVVTLQVMAAPY